LGIPKDIVYNRDMDNKPAVILVNSQMGENIGACARAMLNCGLTDMRLVNPRDGWPSAVATANASGAFDIMPPVQVFENTEDALKDCHYVYATTARPRDMIKPVLTAKSAAQDMVKRAQDGQKIGLMFGAERTGLENEDVALAHAIVTIPLNPEFSSLNLAQGVLLLAYEWSQMQYEAPECALPTGKTDIAAHGEVDNFLERLMSELDNHRFFRDEAMKPSMVRNLKNMFIRSEMTEQEVRTFHGIISALTGKKERS